MSYKFVSEDDDMFRIQHPDGSQFSIAKNAVGPGVHKQIKALKPVKMSEGGEVPDNDFEPQDQSDAGQWLRNTFGGEKQADNAQVDIPDNYGPVSTPIANPQAAPIPQLDNASIMPQSVQEMPPQDLSQKQEPAQPQGIPSGMNDAYANSFAQKESGIKEMAAAQEKAGKEQSAAYAAQVDQAAKEQAHFEQEHAKLDSEHKQLFDAVLNDKIDPQRLMGNMSTGNKIIAAISVALSGIGSGLTGQPNMAMAVIQKNIDRDIDAQKMELGKKNTLLSENVRRYGDLRTATQMTQLQMNAMTQAKIAQFAAQSNSAQAAAQAKLLLGDLGLQAAQLKQQAALRQMASNGGNYDPSILVPHLVPKEHQESVYKELERAQNTVKMHDKIMATFEQAVKDVQGVGRLTSNLKEPRSLQALDQAMQPTFSDIDHTVREAAMNHARKNIAPSQFDTGSDIQTRRSALESYLSSKSSAPRAKSFGIDFNKFGSTSAQQAPEEKTMGGIAYVKVPGGWKRK